MQREIDHLNKKLRHAQRRWTPSQSDSSSDGEKDGSYRRRSRTPPSESFSYEEEYHCERRYNSPTRKGQESYEQSIELDFQVALHAQDWRGNASSVVPSANVHHLQWSNKPCEACEPFQSKNGYPLQRWSFDVQGVPIQFGTRGDEVVRRPKGRFHRFLQGAHPSIWLSFYYV